MVLGLSLRHQVTVCTRELTGHNGPVCHDDRYTMPTTQPSVLSQLPRTVWVLGFVSLLMDVSSEMIHSLLPMFLVTVLGTSALTVGLIEGAAEATALIV